MTRGSPASAEHTLETLERAELRQELEAKRVAARRHGLWAMVGLSPAAVVPLIVTAHEFGIVVASACTVFVSGVEAWRAIQAHMDAQECEARIRAVSAGREAAS